MNAAIAMTPGKLGDFLLNVATRRPVFVWGAPGIGKSAIVERFAESLGMPCVSMLGSQLAPEDIIGVPQIQDGKSFFCPPRSIARDEAYCLFLDELNACSHEVQKAFYSLIHDRRIGEYALHEDSIVIGAGNRAQDSAIVKPMSSALVNRMIHVHVKADHREWLEWAAAKELHPLVVEYVTNRPDHLFSEPPKNPDETFSTPRSWHMLSDGLKGFGNGISEDALKSLAHGCLTDSHAIAFLAFIRTIRNKYALAAILKGDAAWPRGADDHDVLYFLAHSFRAHLIKELPESGSDLTATQRQLAVRAKALLKDLAGISAEVASMAVLADSGGALPSWFQVEIARDLPRIVIGKEARNGKP